jgi:hypothetical protein
MTFFATSTVLCAALLMQSDRPSLTVVDPKSSAEKTEEKTAQAAPTSEPIDVPGLLNEGRANSLMPKGMIIRISACMGEADDNTPEVARELVELWEFTPGEVHRVERDSREGKSVYKRLESRRFDTSGLCKLLLEGKAMEIQARKGTGPETILAGTIYHRGSRSIEVEFHGQTILDLSETNGPFLHVYRETDAKAFGALYERLAAQARPLFKSKTDK